MTGERTLRSVIRDVSNWADEVVTVSREDLTVSVYGNIIFFDYQSGTHPECFEDMYDLAYHNYGGQNYRGQTPIRRIPPEDRRWAIERLEDVLRATREITLRVVSVVNAESAMLVLDGKKPEAILDSGIKAFIGSLIQNLTQWKLPAIFETINLGLTAPAEILEVRRARVRGPTTPATWISRKAIDIKLATCYYSATPDRTGYTNLALNTISTPGDKLFTLSRTSEIIRWLAECEQIFARLTDNRKARRR